METLLPGNQRREGANARVSWRRGVIRGFHELAWPAAQRSTSRGQSRLRPLLFGVLQPLLDATFRVLAQPKADLIVDDLSMPVDPKGGVGGHMVDFVNEGLRLQHDGKRTPPSSVALPATS